MANPNYEPCFHLNTTSAGPSVQRCNLPVLRIRPLAPTTAARVAETEKHVKKFEAEAPHHMVMHTFPAFYTLHCLL
jgi:hypothetical protein